MILIHVPSLCVDGMALCPFVLVKRIKNSKELLNHERIHIQQQLEMGILPFYIWYATEFAFRLMQYKKVGLAYRNISFEREAYSKDSNLSYLKNRNFWTFLKYL